MLTDDRNAVHCEAKIGTMGHDTIGFAQSNPLIDEWGHNWPDGEISYRLNNYTKDIKKESFQDRAVTAALMAWQLRVSKIRFRRERNPHVEVDFDVSFENLAHFDNQRGVLAHAYFPGQGKASGDCHINDEWDWVPAMKHADANHPPLVPVLIHEFGHSLGLRHDTENRGAIMYPSFSLNEKKNKLHTSDITRIQSRYGKRKLSQRVIDYFQRRRDMAWDFRQ